MKYLITEIDEDGDIKTLYSVRLDHQPQIGETLMYMDLDKRHRAQYRVADVYYPIVPTHCEDKEDNTSWVIQPKNATPMIIVTTVFYEELDNLEK